MTPSSSSPTRSERHRVWLIALIVVAVGAAAFAAYTVAFAGTATPSQHQMRSPAGEPATSPTQNTSARVVAKPMAKSVPTRLRIPAIGVDSDLMALGLDGDGTLETPPGAFPAGWFTGAPTPGELGPAIIAGHVRYNAPGVFARLTDLRPDDQISVKRADGSTATFRVIRLEHFAKSKFPTQKVYGNIDRAGLRLITCGGLDASTNEFEENVVVFADLVRS